MKYVYKLVAALGALSVIPLIGFLKIIYFKISSTVLSTIFLVGQLIGNETLSQTVQENGGNAPSSIADMFSIYDIYALIEEFDVSADSANIAEKIQPLITPAITTGVAMILLAICAIVTAVFAFVMKDNRKVIYSSIVGIGLSLVVKECFEGLAAPILEGTVSIATIMESFWGAFIGNFEALNLTTNFWFIPLTFGAIILWTVLYNYTLPEKEKKERKRMLGEADDQ